MYATLRQKACIPCAASKRRCDKQVPECQRCLDRDVDCAYPQPKRRQRTHMMCDSQLQQFSAVPDLNDVNALESILDFEPWAEIPACSLDICLPDAMLPDTLTPSASDTSSSIQRALLASSEPSTTAPLWFLQEDTWELGLVAKDSDCVVDIEAELMAYVRSLDELMRFWITNGYNGFIHRRLYEKGMPACIQDAFTTLATYIGRTPAVEDFILQIANERSAALIKESPPAASGAQAILDHLARAQALLVYAFIRLFDGSVRVRASAEKELPVLREWMVQMWKAAKEYQIQDDPPGHNQWPATEFDREYSAYSEPWRLWTLTESIRRTHVVIESTINVYDAMTRGVAECAGAPMVTHRRGLWEAESAMEWFELCHAKSPILAPCLQPVPLLSRYEAEEIDDLLKIMWSVIVGSDRIQYWNERKIKINRK